MNLRSTLATAAVVSVTATMLAAAPASANDDDVIRRGSCSEATHWKVKAGPDDGRIEVEGEIESNRNGQRWRWRMMHNGSVSARGTRVTTAPAAPSRCDDSSCWGSANAQSGASDLDLPADRGLPPDPGRPLGGAQRPLTVTCGRC